MLYGQIISTLKPILPKAEVYLASKMDPNWEGVAVEVNNIFMVIYPTSSVANSKDTDWLVDVMQNDGNYDFDPDVNEFPTCEDAIGFIFAKYLLLTK